VFTARYGLKLHVLVIFDSVYKIYKLNSIMYCNSFGWRSFSSDLGPRPTILYVRVEPWWPFLPPPNCGYTCRCFMMLGLRRSGQLLRRSLFWWNSVRMLQLCGYSTWNMWTYRYAVVNSKFSVYL